MEFRPEGCGCLTTRGFRENCLLGGRGLYDCLQKHNLSFLLFQGQKYSPQKQNKQDLCGSLCLILIVLSTGGTPGSSHIALVFKQKFGVACSLSKRFPYRHSYAFLINPIRATCRVQRTLLDVTVIKYIILRVLYRLPGY